MVQHQRMRGSDLYFVQRQGKWPEGYFFYRLPEGSEIPKSKEEIEKALEKAGMLEIAVGETEIRETAPYQHIQFSKIKASVEMEDVESVTHEGGLWGKAERVTLTIKGFETLDEDDFNCIISEIRERGLFE